MDWTLKENMVGGLFHCATLTGCRWCCTTIVQVGAETSDTPQEAVKSKPHCSWKVHSRRVGACVGDENTGSRSIVQHLRITSVIRPQRRTSVVAW